MHTLTELAESHCRQISRAFAEYTFAKSSRVTSVRNLRFPDHIGRDISLDSVSNGTFINMMTSAEEYVSQALLSCLEHVTEYTKLYPFLESTWRKRLDVSTLTWKEKRDAYKEFLGITSDLVAPATGFIEARNAISHASGRLTTLQRRKRDSVEKAIIDAGLEIEGGYLRLDESQLRHTQKELKRFISILDENVQKTKGGISSL